MKLNVKDIGEPEELEIAVNNLGLRMPFITTSGGKPVITYFGDIPFSQTPRTLLFLHMFKDEKGNKCAVFCGAVIEDNNTAIAVEVKVSLEHLEAFLMNDSIIFTFCDKIKKIDGDRVVCNKERTIVVPNSLNKTLIKKLLEEMRYPGDENEAWENYLKKHRYPPCLASWLGREVRF